MPVGNVESGVPYNSWQLGLLLTRINPPQFSHSEYLRPREFLFLAYNVQAIYDFQARIIREEGLPICLPSVGAPPIEFLKFIYI